jgi:hypothetical protein
MVGARAVAVQQRGQSQDGRDALRSGYVGRCPPQRPVNAAAACGLLALGPMSGRKMGRGYRRAVNFSLLGAGEPARVSAGHGLGLRLL